MWGRHAYTVLSLEPQLIVTHQFQMKKSLWQEPAVVDYFHKHYPEVYFEFSGDIFIQTCARDLNITVAIIGNEIPTEKFAVSFNRHVWSVPFDSINRKRASSESIH